MKESCVYYTWYKGNKMPPNYIGSSYSYRVEKENYHGSVVSKKWKKIWDCEIKNNSHLFETKILIRFSNRQDATDIEEKIQRKLDVVQSKEYINESFANKGFSTLGIKWTKERKDKQTGINHWNYGNHWSNKIKKKISNRDYSINSDPVTKKKISDSLINTIKLLGVHWCKGQNSPRKGKTLVDEYGIKKANKIRNDISIAAKNRKRGICKYCHIEMDNSNLNKYHNENCINHENILKRNENIQKRKIKCPYCNKEGSKTSMKRWHFDNCKFKDNSSEGTK